MKPLPTHRPVTLQDVVPARWSEERPELAARIPVNKLLHRMERIAQQQADLAERLADIERTRRQRR